MSAPESELMVRRLAAIADSKRADAIVALDVSGLVSYTDVLLICTGRNERQVKAISDEVRAEMKRSHGEIPARMEGEREARWVILDYLDCVVHVQVPEARERYRLDALWGEAPEIDLQLPVAPAAASA